MDEQMKNDQRVLGYCKSRKLTKEDLMEISGGEIKLTCQQTQKGSGYYPGPTDVEFDQLWD